jgi:conjugal transfer pilus assembly protein TraU
MVTFLSRLCDLSRHAVFRSIAVFFALIMTSSAQASPCNDGFINPLTKVAWQCVFPITIAGVRIGAKSPLDEDSTGSPVCVCNRGGVPTLGVKVSFWAPNRMIDTVSNPGCMMALGADILNTGGKLHGRSSAQTTNGTRYTHQQSHYYIAPLWAMLDLFTDIPCLTEKEFDVAMMSELLPTYQNEVLGAVINPEAVLFGNPASVLACIADSAEAIRGKTIDALFWCSGSWGGIYPLGGSSFESDEVAANAQIAAKQIYMMGRAGLLWIDNKSGCSQYPATIWKKSRHKLQEMEPVKSGKCVNIGRAGLLWTSLKHPPHKDNYAWQVFEKRICCITPY